MKKQTLPTDLLEIGMFIELPISWLAHDFLKNILKSVRTTRSRSCRLKIKEIHIYGRICAIADVFDALTAERSYKKAMKPFDAL